MSEIPQALGQYLLELFENLYKELDANAPVFSFSPSIEGTGYNRTVYLSTTSSTRQSFSLCCCSDKVSDCSYQFFGAYVVDALDEELRRVLSEQGVKFLEQSSTPLFDGISSKRAAGSLRKLAGQRLEEDFRCSYSVFFDVIDCLSLADYEQERAKGTLVFLPYFPENVDELCAWSVFEANRVECTTEQLRVLRKFLAGVTPDRFPDEPGLALLFANVEEVPVFLGAVALDNDGLPPESIRSACVQIAINGPLRWDVSLFGKHICRRDASGLCFPDRFDDRTDDEANVQVHIHMVREDKLDSRIHDALRKAFTRPTSKEAVNRQLDRLTKIVKAVKLQRHGAALIIGDWNSGKCEETLKRLIQHKKAVPVSFRAIDERPDAITCAAKMDGAILADVCSGEIIALAAILDGESCMEGDASRGSRYNSIANATKLLRFSEDEPEIVSFIFSSDGGMDILF